LGLVGDHDGAGQRHAFAAADDLGHKAFAGLAHAAGAGQHRHDVGRGHGRRVGQF